MPWTNFPNGVVPSEHGEFSKNWIRLSALNSALVGSCWYAVWGAYFPVFSSKSMPNRDANIEAETMLSPFFSNGLLVLSNYNLLIGGSFPPSSVWARRPRNPVSSKEPSSVYWVSTFSVVFPNDQTLYLGTTSSRFRAWIMLISSFSMEFLRSSIPAFMLPRKIFYGPQSWHHGWLPLT